jgi:hypothetical protein
VALVCVFLMLCWLWPNDAASPHQPIVPTKPSRRKRSKSLFEKYQAASRLSIKRVIAMYTNVSRVLGNSS